MSSGLSSELVLLATAVGAYAGSPERILEIECGSGEGVLFLAREFPAARVRGVDRSEETISAAKSRIVLDPEGRVAFKRGDPGSLPYPDEMFDLIVHARGRVRAREVARVLRPGGHLIHLETRTRSRFSARLRGWALSRAGFRQVEVIDAEERAATILRLGPPEAGRRD